ncbi:uncharacterized protein EHS24_007030 [Apiotrichum porosum]|uniref:Uncharacterized protein n=1 Tax=Apiotrichum porosum TaxID=105984 RepID=A0A427XWZ3_9TREE|nr:uncharacterized protein EHS24_007030 [Apiotrichum porosum]RSH83352.1 hypothetical protein EHS24_007030 [Apiotrichum porosum]
MSTQHSTKARHYAALAARIRELRGNLDETEQLMGHMSDHLLGMRKLAAANGAQFMAVSRLLDVELTEAKEAEMARQAQQEQ